MSANDGQLGLEAPPPPGPSLLPHYDPPLGFPRARAPKRRKQGGRPADEEQRPPPEVGKERAVAQRREQVAEGVSLLQQAGHHAAITRRDLLHHQRRAHPPFGTHPDPEQRAQHEKRGVVRRQACEHLDQRVEHQVDHQRQLAPVAVGEQPEDERAHRPEGERECDRERDRGVRLPELPGDRRERHHDEEEVERVERPAEEAGDDGGAPVVGGRAYGGHWCPASGASTLLHPCASPRLSHSCSGSPPSPPRAAPRARPSPCSTCASTASTLTCSRGPIPRSWPPRRASCSPRCARPTWSRSSTRT